jgi:hypothetical protein
MLTRLLLASTIALVSTLALAQSPTRLRGMITAFDGSVLSVKSREGEMLAIQLADNVGVSAVIKASLADIKPGVYIGTAAVPQPGGTQKALEVLIFPEAMRGAGEGHRAWDLMPESTMTNATIAETVESVDGQLMTLKYKEGEKKISIPKDAPIVTFAPATKADLKVGEGVFISAEKQADGSYTAARVTVGRDGVAPPM